LLSIAVSKQAFLTVMQSSLDFNKTETFNVQIEAVKQKRLGLTAIANS
jgi:hypothetical protein